MTCAWIALDWGSSNLRAWAMDAGGAVVDRRVSDQGAGGLQSAEFEPALLALIGDWLGEAAMPIVACGMVGSRQGWVDAPYRDAPCDPREPAAVSARAKDSRLAVRILGGVRQRDPADVMRGEETQIAGLLAADPGFEGAVCLPGTHSKWVEIRGGRITRFVSYMTGEVFALLAGRSVLRHTVAASGFEKAPFLAALDDALTHPDQAPARLFPLRAEALIGDLSPIEARARLSGLLIGQELGAARAMWSAGRVALIGEGALIGLYAQALAHLGVQAEAHDGAEVVLAGLASAHAALQGDFSCEN